MSPRGFKSIFASQGILRKKPSKKDLIDQITLAKNKIKELKKVQV